MTPPIQPNSKHSSDSLNDSSNQGGGRNAAIPWNWFRRWLGSASSDRAKPSKPKHKLDAILLEDRILYSASPMLVLVDPDTPLSDPIEAIDQIFFSLEASSMGVASLPAEGASSDSLLAASPSTSPMELDASHEKSILESGAIAPLGDSLAAGSEEGAVVWKEICTYTTLDPVWKQAADGYRTADTLTEADAIGDGSSDTLGTSVDVSLGPTDQPDELRRELVVIQEGLYDLDAILADLYGAHDSDRSFDVVVLNRLEDGFAQLDHLFSQYDDLDAIHIVSHGTDGILQLGGSWLTSSNLQEHAATLQQLGIALAENGDLLIYGCDIASGVQGQNLVDAIAQITQADVAASSDLTGFKSLGGDWNLEYRLGQIQTDVFASLGLQESWQSLLATVNVTTTTDENNGNTLSIASLQSTPGGAGISLREAIIAANNTAGADTIVLGAGTYTLTIAGTGDDSGALGDLDIQTEITITGAGVGSTTISGGGIDRVIEIDGSGNLTLSDVKLTGGSINNNGGAFLIEQATGSATLIRVEITGNAITTGGNYGGGIHNEGGTLVLQDCLIYGNTATGLSGGGLSNQGTTSIARTSIFNNSAASGGGVYQLTGALTAENATISGNTSSGSGGGIHIAGGTTSLTFSTIANNTATSGNGGGAIVAAGTLTSQATIFGDNSSSTGGRDLHGTFTSSGYNIIEHNSGFTGSVASDIKGSDAGLSILTADSLTGQYVHSIQSTSIAYNAATGSSPTVDQRGKTRSGTLDIGAFEYVAFTVTNTNDSGANSLRQAIIDANTYVGFDTINFNIAGGGSKIIALSSALSDITGATSIDGTTQSGYVAGSNIPIIIDGNDLTGDGLTLSSTADGSTIRGLIVRDFTGNGIRIASNSSSNIIAGNWVGYFNSDGTAAATSEANTGNGISVQGDSNLIGGTTTADRNVSSGNNRGILLTGSNAFSNVVSGNYIGTSITGSAAMGNTLHGIRIDAGATLNTIGGATTSNRNIIAATTAGDGIEIAAEASDGNTVRNNWIGVGADGVTVLGHSGDGIRITSGADNSSILDNVIVGSGGNGITLNGTTSGTVIQGNRIGINAAGTITPGNAGNGISIVLAAFDNTIGGTSAGQSNIVVNSGTGGVNKSGIAATGTGTGNAIVGNSIYDNAGLGIDLGTTGVTANDSLDPDSGSNNLQNFPVITSATTNGSQLTVSGSINSLASLTGVVLHFYATPSTGNHAIREGKKYLGSTTVNTDASGNANFNNINLATAASAGEVITATATYLNSTSEFSHSVVATLSSGNSAPSNATATATTDGGLSINNDGGNNVYFRADDGGAIFGGRTQLSIEMRFSSSNLFAVGDEMNLLSYATSSADNEVRLAIRRPSSAYILDFFLNGTSVTATGYDASLLLNGQAHTVSITWSNSAGAYVIYVDGASVFSGSGFKTGVTIGSGGVLAIGNEQDSVGGSFESRQAFKGTLLDARIFSDVRTATEVASGYRTTLPNTEGGLVANWRFHDLSTACVTRDSVSGNNLTEYHATGTNFIASNSALTFQVTENSAANTVVGSVYGIDIDREAKISQLLAADSTLRYSAETGKFYRLVDATQTWTNAQTAAIGTTLSGITGELLTVRSAAEQTLAHSFAQCYRAPFG